MKSDQAANDELFRRIHNDVIDNLDEEYEMELEDRVAAPEGPTSAKQVAAEREARHKYFGELFRLQGELVNLQEWLVHTGHKVVICFEGRDAAGKGGVIKRITQRLNPRV